MADKNDEVAAGAAAGSAVDTQRRRVFCGLMASGSLLLSTSTAKAAVAEAKAAEARSEVGTVWWSELVARDLPRATDFYANVIGWKTKAVDIEDASRPAAKDAAAYTLFVADGNDVAGAKSIDEDFAAKGPMWLTYFQVDNVDAAVKRAIASGGSVIVEAFNAGTSARTAVIADAEGNAFGVAHPL